MSFKIGKENYTNVNEIFIKYFPGQSYIQPSEYFEISLNHILASNEMITLFKFYFSDIKLEENFLQLAKKIGVKIEYETITGEEKLFEKKGIAIV